MSEKILFWIPVAVSESGEKKGLNDELIVVTVLGQKDVEKVLSKSGDEDML